MYNSHLPIFKWALERLTSCSKWLSCRFQHYVPPWISIILSLFHCLIQHISEISEERKIKCQRISNKKSHHSDFYNQMNTACESSCSNLAVNCDSASSAIVTSIQYGQLSFSCFCRPWVLQIASGKVVNCFSLVHALISCPLLLQQI